MMKYFTSWGTRNLSYSLQQQQWSTFYSLHVDRSTAVVYISRFTSIVRRLESVVYNSSSSGLHVYGSERRVVYSS